MTARTRSGPSASTESRRDERAVDAARKPEDDAGKPILLHVVAQAQHARLVGGGIALLDLGARRPWRRSIRSAPAPLGERDRLLPGGKLRGETAVGIEHEGGAVEDELVLAADLVEIEKWQAGLGDARLGLVQAHVGLGPVEGRAVGRDEDFRAVLGKALGHVGAPDVLADRHAEPDAAKGDRLRHRPLRKDALLIEDAVVGQIDLEAHRGDLARVKQRHRVIDLAALGPDRAREHGGARPQLGGERLHARGAPPPGRPASRPGPQADSP